MTFSVCFVERRDGSTPSLERVFRIIARELEKKGIKTKFQKLPGGNGLFGIVEGLISFRPEPADIYHITGHVHFIGLKLDPNKTALTIHDLWILHNRTGLRRWALKKLLFDWPLRRLKWITTISEATKRELIERVNADPNSVEVIPNPVDLPDAKPKRTFNAEKPTILQVGTAPHKNLERVAEALQAVSCRLRIVGQLSDAQRNALKANAIDFTNDPHLSEAEMNEAYLSADLLVFCSQFEGFGLPVAEAQAVGLPVITSDREPMRSVAGDGAVLADPDDVDSIRSAVTRIIGEAELRDGLVENGYKNVGRFAPEVIAGQYIKLYERMLSMKGIKS